MNEPNEENDELDVAPSTFARHRGKLVPVVVILALLIAALVFREELRVWFGGEPVAQEDTASEPEAGEAPSAPIPAHAFSEPALAELREALGPYEQIRATLAADSVAGMSPAAQRVALAFDAAAEGTPEALRDELRDGAEAARALADERDIEVARSQFGEVSRALVGASEADPRLRGELHVFRCPMAEGFQKWVQPSPNLENPYMGQRMLQCGSESDWAVAAAAPTRVHDHADGAIDHWTCPMHPSVNQDGPGACPICGMDLTPVTTEEMETGTILVDAARRQRIGLRTEVIHRRELTTSFRAVGVVTYDESRLTEVNLHMSGWVRRLVADETGQRVRRGQVLLTLYSPELYAAQLEYLSALQSRSFGGEAGNTATNPLAQAARQRLLLLGMAATQVDRVQERGEASEDVPILSPASGYVIDKTIVDGAYIEAGQRVYRIANLDEVWVEAEVYEADLPNVRMDQEVTIRLPSRGAQAGSEASADEIRGRVSFIHPSLDPASRTAKVRIALDNLTQDGELALRPDMVADVLFEVSLGEALAVPAEAVIYTGPRRIVFLDLGEGRLQPKVVELGARAGEDYVVRSGLSDGDVVVTSGTFLVASESRLRSSLDAWSSVEAAE